MIPQPTRTPANGARFCRQLAAGWRRAQETQRIFSVSRLGLYSIPDERKGWSQAAARCDARAGLLDWAAAAPGERLIATLTQLATEGLRDDAEGRLIQQLVADLRGHARELPP